MNKPRTREELLKLKEKKISTCYKVKGMSEASTKTVDMTKRIVTGISNTFLFFDSDADVLLPGCTKKSIADRGPASKGKGKIKNVKDHDLTSRIGVPQLLEERTIDGKQCQYFESRMIESTKGNDTLIEYQEGAIDQHSIGFRYVGIELITADDQDWTKWVNMILNPKAAEDNGYMFLVDEIEQFEWSPVSFGANELTPYLGLKSVSKEAMIIKAFERIELLEDQYRKGRQSDETLYSYHLQTLQLKQIINELLSQEPSIKDTLIKGRQNTKDTTKEMVTCPDCGEEFDSNENQTPDGQMQCPECDCQFEKSLPLPVQTFDLNAAIKNTTFFT